MARNVIQVTFAAANSKSVAAAGVETSDLITLDPTAYHREVFARFTADSTPAANGYVAIDFVEKQSTDGGAATDQTQNTEILSIPAVSTTPVQGSAEISCVAISAAIKLSNLTSVPGTFSVTIIEKTV